MGSPEHLDCGMYEGGLALRWQGAWGPLLPEPTKAAVRFTSHGGLLYYADILLLRMEPVPGGCSITREASTDCKSRPFVATSA